MLYSVYKFLYCNNAISIDKMDEQCVAMHQYFLLFDWQVLLKDKTFSLHWLVTANPSLWCETAKYVVNFFSFQEFEIKPNLEFEHLENYDIFIKNIFIKRSSTELMETADFAISSILLPLYILNPSSQIQIRIRSRSSQHVRSVPWNKVQQVPGGQVCDGASLEQAEPGGDRDQRVHPGPGHRLRCGVRQPALRYLRWRLGLLQGTAVLTTRIRLRQIFIL